MAPQWWIHTGNHADNETQTQTRAYRYTYIQNIWNQFDETTPPSSVQSPLECVFFSVTLSILLTSSTTPFGTHFCHTHTHIHKDVFPEKTPWSLPCSPITRYFWILIGHLRSETATPSEGSVTSTPCVTTKHQHLTNDSEGSQLHRQIVMFSDKVCREASAGTYVHRYTRTSVQI